MDSYAWGPERATYLEGGQAGYPCFNSITDAGMGDERNFVRVKEIDTLNARTDSVEVEPGKSYEVYIYFRNDALETAAEEVRAQSYFSSVLDKEHPGKVMAMIAAGNTTPGKVWDGASFVYNGSGSVELRYVNDSAVVRTAGWTDGAALKPAELFTNTGATLGYAFLDGKVPAGAEYAGYVSYEVRVVASERTDFATTYGTIFATAEERPAGGGGTVAPADDIPRTGVGFGVVALAVGLGAIVALAVALVQGVARKVRR